MEKATDKHSSLNETAGENKNSGTVTRQSKMHEAQGDKNQAKIPASFAQDAPNPHTQSASAMVFLNNTKNSSGEAAPGKMSGGEAASVKTLSDETPESEQESRSPHDDTMHGHDEGLNDIDLWPPHCYADKKESTRKANDAFQEKEAQKKNGADGDTDKENISAQEEVAALKKSLEQLREEKVIRLKEYKNFYVQINMTPDLEPFAHISTEQLKDLPEDDVEAVFQILWGRRKKRK